MKFEPFNQLSRTLIDDINRDGKLITYAKKESCMLGDDLLNYFYIIIKGRMKVFDMNIDSGREQTLFLLTRGDMFDPVTLLDGQPHHVMTEALETLSVIQIPMEKARHWLQSNPAFNQLLLPYLGQQMRTLEKLAVSLSLYDTSERLMKLILDNVNPKTAEPTLLNDLSNTEIANMIGTVRQVVERNLHTLEENGLIETGRKKLHIKNLRQLEQKLTRL